MATEQLRFTCSAQLLHRRIEPLVHAHGVDMDIEKLIHEVGGKNNIFLNGKKNRLIVAHPAVTIEFAIKNNAIVDYAVLPGKRILSILGKNHGFSPEHVRDLEAHHDAAKKELEGKLRQQEPNEEASVGLRVLAHALLKHQSVLTGKISHYTQNTSARVCTLDIAKD